MRRGFSENFSVFAWAFFLHVGFVLKFLWIRRLNQKNEEKHFENGWDGCLRFFIGCEILANIFGESQCSYEIYNCSILENFGKMNLYEIQSEK